MAVHESLSDKNDIEPFIINEVTSLSDLKDTIALIEVYTAWIGADLSYQGYAQEIASMPGKYATTAGGCLMLARHRTTHEPIGCVAMRALPYSGKEAACEMKRLYVAPAGRRTGLGRTLALKAVDEAQRLGYREMYLDTLPFMHAAIKMYENLGFRKCERYYDSAPSETIFFVKTL